MPRTAAMLAELGLMLLALGAPAALGGVHRPAIVALTLLACLTLLAVWRYRIQTGRIQTGRGLHLPWFGAVLLGVTAYTALQALPLPVGLLRLLAPATVELLEVALAPAGGPGSWQPISLDPAATLWEVLKLGSCTLAFLAAHNFLYRRERRDRVLLVLVAGGVLLTILGYLGAVAAPGQALLLYTPEQGRAGALIATSFVNPNHAAAFFLLCTLIAVSLAVTTRDLQQRVLLGLGAVLLGSSVFLSLSRGGILALGVGLALLAALFLLPSPGGPARSRLSALVPAATAAILLLSGWLAYDAIIDEFRATLPELDSNLGKIGLWSSGLSMLLANPWVGVGRGAFFTTFPRYNSGELSLRSTFSHLENQFLHLPIELGLLVGALLILATALALTQWFWRGRRDPQSLALLAGLLALGFHNLFDFNLEILGLALPAAILAGMLSAGYGATRQRRQRQQTDFAEPDPSPTGPRPPSAADPPQPADSSEAPPAPRQRRHVPRRAHFRGKLRSGLLLLTSGLLALLALGLAAVWPPLAADDLARLAAIAQQSSYAKAKPEIVKSLSRRPGDYLPQLIAAQLALQEQNPKALSWLNRALYLYPHSPDLHLETARALLTFGRRPQALLELRLALENGAPQAATLGHALALARSQDEIRSALPPDPELQAQAILRLIRTKRPQEALALSQESSKRWPQSPALRQAQVSALLANQQPEQAVALARQLTQDQSTPEHYQLWAQAAAQAQPGSELAILGRAQKRYPQEERLAFALARAQLRAKKLELALELANELLSRAATPVSVAAAHDLLAEIYQADGRTHRARYEREQAKKIRTGHR